MTVMLCFSCGMTVYTCAPMQVSGEVFSQTGAGQRDEQNDGEQPRYCPGTQSALGENWGVRGDWEGGDTIDGEDEKGNW